MTLQVLVGSKSNPSVLVTVEGQGLDPISAKRAAIQFARARHHIADPIALSDDQAALRAQKPVQAPQIVAGFRFDFETGCYRDVTDHYYRRDGGLMVPLPCKPVNNWLLGDDKYYRN